MSGLTKAEIDRTIILHRASIVQWFDARFPDTKHMPHPDRLSSAARAVLEDRD